LARLLWFFVCVLSLGATRAEAKDVPKIDVYTMGRGDKLTEKFGHAAVCTRYSRPDRDRCYNYGTANFEDPAFMWTYLRGRPRFWVAITTPERMMEIYTRSDRDVWVQELPLSDEEALSIRDKLRHDSLEENRYYIYHHYFDNCTTRVRDILDEATGGRLSKDAHSLATTYRDISRRGLSENAFLVAASDFILGRVGDRELAEYEAMFLPDFFRVALKERFNAEPKQLYKRAGDEFSDDPGLVRIWMQLLVLLLVAPLWWCHWKSQRPARRHLLPPLLAMIGIGVLLWTLAMISPLPMMRGNENLLLFLPLDLLLFKSGRIRLRYAQLRLLGSLLCVTLAGVGVLHQPLWLTATLPILVLLPLAFDRAEPQSTKSS
jgi:hypothetical protein